MKLWVLWICLPLFILLNITPPPQINPIIYKSANPHINSTLENVTLTKNINYSKNILQYVEWIPAFKNVCVILIQIHIEQVYFKLYSTTIN